MNFNLYKSDPALMTFTNAFADSSGPRVLNDHGLRCGTEKSMLTARFVISSLDFELFKLQLCLFTVPTDMQRPTNQY